MDGTFLIDPASQRANIKMRIGRHCTEYILMHNYGHVRTRDGGAFSYIYRE
jgi:hypothetical protein